MMATGIQKNFPDRTLRDFFSVLFRQKRKVILFFCFVIITTALGTFLAPKIYQSQAKLLVRLGRESVTLDPTAAMGQVVNISQTRENEIKSELEILNSRDLAEEVVDTIGYQAFLTTFGNPDAFIKSDSSRSPGKTKPKGSAFGAQYNGQADQGNLPKQMKDRDEAIRNLIKTLTIEFQKNSNIITIAYDAPSQKLSQLVVAKLIDFYLDKHISVHRTAGSEDFFSKQAEELRAKLAQTEEALRDLKNKTGVASVTEQRSILLNRIGSLQRAIEETDAALAASRSKVQAMQSTLAGLPKTLLRTKIAGYSGNPIDYLQQRLHDLQLKEQDLLSKYTEKNPLVMEVRRQIAGAQALLKNEDATHGQVTQLALLVEKATLSELQGKTAALKGGLAEAQGELRNLNESEIKLAQLHREVEIQTANYRSYADKLEQARIDRALEMGRISNISVVQPATYPVKPIRPRKALNLALGLFLGVFGGLGIAFLAEHMDHSFQTPDDVEKMLQLPVLAVIPRHDNRGGAAATMREKGPILFPRTAVGRDVSLEAQGYQAIINHIRLATAGSKQTASLFAITSWHKGEGVSSIAANIAISLANLTDGRILLVDANLNQPSVHMIFGVSRSPGLTEIFGKAQLDTVVIKPSSIKNLDILPSGQGEVNLSLLFDSKPFAELLSLWRREYSYVIFDMPAMGEVSAGIRLATLADGVFLVVEADRTRWEVAQQAKEMLAQAKVNVLGVVLNKRQFPIPEWLYRIL